ncbi:membrane bound O-acyl transferase family-domain-containing protein [Xylariaceae sp. FL0255]|nr:membrane bound O-acyl transferase family-domain-containing protein [Xylariaceae sp. FL0255]
MATQVSGSDGTALWVRAVAQAAIFYSLYSFLVVTTSKEARMLRLSGVLVMAYLTKTLAESLAQLLANPRRSSAIVPLLWIQFMSASEIMGVSRVQADELIVKENRSVGRRFSAALGLMWNFRRIGTKWQAINFQNAAIGARTPPKPVFLLERCVTTTLAYAILQVMLTLPPPDARLIDTGKETLAFGLDSVSQEDAIFRAIVTVSFWISTALINLVMSNTMAILAVFANLNSPADCPPLYGDFFKSYTVRNFWGISWHQCLRKGLTSHANEIATLFPSAIAHGKLTRRYLRIILAFLISGLIHHTSDWAMGMGPTDAGSLKFFILQPLGIMVEDGVQELTRTWPMPGWVRKLIGYVWVFLFLIWSTPTWCFPQMRTGDDASVLLPVRLPIPDLTAGLAQ